MAVKTRAISFAWGFCEATFFFLVPDIWLSRIVILNRREAYLNIIVTVLGALLGGFVMYALGVYAFETTEKMLPIIPAISADMVENVGQNMKNSSMFLEFNNEMFAGIPYKIYALWAGHYSAPIILFIVASFIARCLRFVLVVFFAHAISCVIKPYVKQETILKIHMLAWACFYAYYFHALGI